MKDNIIYTNNLTYTHAKLSSLHLLRTSMRDDVIKVLSFYCPG